MISLAVTISVATAMTVATANLSVATGQEPQAENIPQPADSSQTAQPVQSVIIVVGAEGTPEYGLDFRKWAQRWHEAALKGGCQVRLIGPVAELTPDAALDPVLPPADSGQQAAAEKTPETDLDRLQIALSESGSQDTSEPLWLVLIGHGTFDTRNTSFSMQGPDLTATALKELCQSVQRPIAIINCSSCSAPFLNALSGPRRVVVSATKDASQLQFSRFGDAMSQAISGTDADIDRDGQTSLLEAWLYGARRTAEFYTAEGRLATEHSLLDDNGDQRGTRSEIFSGVRPNDSALKKEELVPDGSLASKWHLVRSEEELRLTADQRKQRDQLETDLELLRQRKDQIPEDEYLKLLEQLLVPLARIYSDGNTGGS